jgi:hypothetical protein
MIREAPAALLYDTTGLIDLGAVGAGQAKYETTFREGLYWVRRVVLIARADQPWQPYVQRQTPGQEQLGWGTPLFGSTITTGVGVWAEVEATITLGARARFGISVPGGVGATTAQMYVQLFN